MSTTKLADAVYEQLGCEDDAEFRDILRDVSRGGAGAGFPGFTYYSDTAEFATENRHLILQALRDDADEFGMAVEDFIASFRCLDDDRETRREILNYLTDTIGEGDVGVCNALTWYALERVATFEGGE